MIKELEKKYREFEARYEELGRMLEDPAVYSDVAKTTEVSRERAA